jgi:hypothetical protein
MRLVEMFRQNEEGYDVVVIAAIRVAAWSAHYHPR